MTICHVWIILVGRPWGVTKRKEAIHYTIYGRQIWFSFEFTRNSVQFKKKLYHINYKWTCSKEIADAEEEYFWKFFSQHNKYFTWVSDFLKAWMFDQSEIMQCNRLPLVFSECVKLLSMLHKCKIERKKFYVVWTKFFHFHSE